MFSDKINSYRIENGRKPAAFDSLVNEYCIDHCWAMIREDKLYHAEECYLNGWAEAVAMVSRGGGDWEEIEERLLQALISSSAHRSVLLNYDTLAYGLIEFKGRVWLTVRGK